MLHHHEAMQTLEILHEAIHTYSSPVTDNDPWDLGAFNLQTKPYEQCPLTCLRTASTSSFIACPKVDVMMSFQ